MCSLLQQPVVLPQQQEQLGGLGVISCQNAETRRSSLVGSRPSPMELYSKAKFVHTKKLHNFLTYFGLTPAFWQLRKVVTHLIIKLISDNFVFIAATGRARGSDNY